MSARKSPGVVREPVQVYLSGVDRAALDRVAVVTGLPRAEVDPRVAATGRRH